MDIHEAIVRYMDYMEGRLKSPGTLKDYRLTLNRFSKIFEVLDDSTIVPFLAIYPHVPTRNKILAHLQSFARWCGIRAPHLVKEFTVTALPTKQPLPEVVPDAERDAFFAALRTLQQPMVVAHAELLKNTGLRFSEAFNLTTANHFKDDSGNEFVRFFGKGGRERLVPLANQEAKIAFRVWVTRPKPSEHIIRRRYKEALQKAGIPRLKPHWFRHTVGTKLAAAGEPYDRIADFLGNSVEVTRSRYARVNTTDLSRMGAIL